MTFDVTTIIIAMSFLAIPTISYLLPSTGQVLVQVGLLFAAQAIILFLNVNPLFGAVVWMIYVGAICVLFLVAVTALTPNQWRTKNVVKRTGVSGTLIVLTISGVLYRCFVEVIWLINNLNTFPNYLNTLNQHRLAPNNYLDVNTLLLQNIGFTEDAKLYLACGILLLVGMFVVIQTTVAPKTINTFIKKNINKLN